MQPVTVPVAVNDIISFAAGVNADVNHVQKEWTGMEVYLLE